MPEPQYHHLKGRTEQGVLVLTITEPQLQGDTLVDSLRRELRTAVGEPPGVQKVVLDLHLVRAVSSEAFRPLLSLRRRLGEVGGRMALCNLSPVVAKTFQVTRLVSTSRSSTPPFETESDVASAIALLNRIPASK
jgi:anti-anti-sigma factor